MYDQMEQDYNLQCSELNAARDRIAGLLVQLERSEQMVSLTQEACQKEKDVLKHKVEEREREGGDGGRGGGMKLSRNVCTHMYTRMHTHTCTHACTHTHTPVLFCPVCSLLRSGHATPNKMGRKLQLSHHYRLIGVCGLLILLCCGTTYHKMDTMRLRFALKWAFVFHCCTCASSCHFPF